MSGTLAIILAESVWDGVMKGAVRGAIIGGIAGGVIYVLMQLRKGDNNDKGK